MKSPDASGGKMERLAQVSRTRFVSRLNVGLRHTQTGQADAINFLRPIEHGGIAPVAHIGQNPADGSFQG